MGRGISPVSKKGTIGYYSGSMNVPFDSWGEELRSERVYDEKGEQIGWVEDQMRFIQEPDIRPITKKDALAEVDAWGYENDDGQYIYGDNSGDVHIIVAYKNGNVIDATEEILSKPIKKSGICGIAVSTGDYEMVWGGEVNKRTGAIEKYQTWSEDGESGKENTYSGYRAVGAYMVRDLTTHEPNGRGGWRPVHKTIRRSTVKKVNIS